MWILQAPSMTCMHVCRHFFAMHYLCCIIVIWTKTLHDLGWTVKITQNYRNQLKLSIWFLLYIWSAEMAISLGNAFSTKSVHVFSNKYLLNGKLTFHSHVFLHFFFLLSFYTILLQKLTEVAYLQVRVLGKSPFNIKVIII